jgi:hypothetical protein
MQLSKVNPRRVRKRAKVFDHVKQLEYITFCMFTYNCIIRSDVAELLRFVLFATKARRNVTIGWRHINGPFFWWRSAFSMTFRGLWLFRYLAIHRYLKMCHRRSVFGLCLWFNLPEGSGKRFHSLKVYVEFHISGMRYVQIGMWMLEWICEEWSKLLHSDWFLRRAQNTIDCWKDYQGILRGLRMVHRWCDHR